MTYRVIHTILFAALPALANEYVNPTTWLESIDRRYPGTMAQRLYDSTVYRKRHDAITRTLKIAYVDASSSEGLVVGENSLRYGGKDNRLIASQRTDGKRPFVARWIISCRRNRDAWVQMSGNELRFVVLNGKQLLRVRNSFYTDQDGTLAVPLKKGKNILAVSFGNRERHPRIGRIIYPDEDEKEFRNLLRARINWANKPESVDRFLELLRVLSADQAPADLIAQGVALYLDSFPYKNNSAQRNALRKQVPKSWSEGIRVIKQGRWGNTYRKILESGQANVTLVSKGTRIIGPFPCKGIPDGFKTSYGPEKGLSLDKGHVYKGKKLDWRDAPKQWKDGSVNDLLVCMEPGENGVAYILRTYESKSDGKMTFSVGSDDAVSIWHNGKRVLHENVARGVAPDQNSFTVQLNKGTHRFLIKIIQGDGGWGFYFDPSGSSSATQQVVALVETAQAHSTAELQNCSAYRGVMNLSRKVRKNALHGAAAAAITSSRPRYYARVNGELMSQGSEAYAKRLVALRKYTSKKVIAGMMMGDEPRDTGIAAALIHLSLVGHQSFASELLETIETAEPEFWQMHSVLLGQIYLRLGYHFTEMGDFKLANALFRRGHKLGADSKKVQKHTPTTQLILETSISENATRKLTVDTQTEQMFEEIKFMLEEPKHTRESYAKIYSFIKQYGTKNLPVASGMQNFRAALLNELEKKPALLAGARSYIQERLGSQGEQAIKESNVGRLEKMLLEFSGFLDDAPLRDALMREYMDRGDLHAAYRHATALTSVKKYQVKAYAYLLHIEAFLKVAPAVRAVVPAELSGRKVKVAGETVTLGQLNERFGVSKDDVPTEGLGACVAAVQLPPVSEIYKTMVPGERSTGVRYSRQPLVPVVANGQILLACPSYLLGLNAKTGNVNWYRPSPFAPMSDTANYFPKLLYPVLDGGDIYNLSTDRGTEMALNAYDEAGEHRWTSLMMDGLSKWYIVSRPTMWMGRCYIFVLSRDWSATPTLGLAVLNRRANRVEKVMRLHRVKGFVSRDYRPSLQDVLFNSVFMPTKDALFASTGCGSIMRLDPRTNTVDWMVTFPEGRLDTYAERKYNVTHPPVLQVVGNTVAVFQPELLQWCGIDKNSGRIIWQNRTPGASHQVHSRGSEHLVISTHRTEPELSAWDPRTGKRLWRVFTNGMRVNGEGVVFGKTVHVPVTNGIASYDLDSGKFRNLQELPFEPDRIAYSHGRWIILAGEQLFIFRPGKRLGEIPPANAIKALGASSQKAPGRESWHTSLLELRQTLPIKVGRTDRDTNLDTYHLSKPGYTLLKSYDSEKRRHQVTLLHEGGMENGVYRPTRIVWQGSSRSLRINGDRILEFGGRGVTVYNAYTRRAIYRYRNVEDNLLTGRDWGRGVTNAHFLGEDKILIMTQRALQVREIPSGKLLKSTSVRGDRMRIASATAQSVHFAVGYRGNEFQTLTLKDMKISKTRALPGRGWIRHLSDSLSYSYWESWNESGSRVFDLSKGTRSILEVRYRARNTRPVLVGNKIYFNGGEAYELGSGRSTKVRSIKRCLVAARGAFIYGTDKTLSYVHEKGRVRLESDISRPLFSDFWINGRNAPQTFTIGDKVFQAGHGRIAGWSTRTGKLVMNSGSAEGFYVELQRSIGVWHGGRLALYGPRRSNGPPIATYQTEVDSNSLWPEGLPAPEPVKHWVKATEDRTNQQVATRYGVGSDGKYVCAKVTFAPGRLPKSKVRLRLSGRWPYHSRQPQRPYFGITWELPQWEHPILHGIDREDISVWQETDEANNVHVHVIVSRQALGIHGEQGLAPDWQLEVEQYSGDRFLGTARQGGVFAPFTNDIPLGCPRQKLMPEEPNHVARTNRFEKTLGFFPSGNEVSRWICDRRVKQGVESNIDLLQKLVKKNRKSYCVVNLLSVLYLEMIEALRQESKDAQVSRSFYAKCMELGRELKGFAGQQGIPQDWSNRALSGLSIRVFPRQSKHSTSVKSIWIGESDHRGYSLDTTGASQLGEDQSKPFLLVVPMGLFFGKPAAGIREFRLAVDEITTLRLGEIHWFSPSGSRLLVSDVGKGQNLRFDWVAEHRIEPYTYAGQAYNVHGYGRSHNGQIRYILTKPISLGKPPEIKMSRDAILSELKNVPSDSRTAPALIDSYWSNLTPEEQATADYLGVCTEVLRRTRNNWHTVNEIAKRSIYYLKNHRKDSHDIAVSEHKEVFTKARVPRDFQREIYSNWVNTFGRSQLSQWLNLGALWYDAQDSFDIEPLPEDVVPFDKTTKFTITRKTRDDKTETSTRKFEYPNHKVKATRSGYRVSSPSNRSRSAVGLVYHAGQVLSKRDRKVYLYLSRHGWDYRASYANAWINGDPVMEAPYRLAKLGVFPIRLEKGTNILLLKLKFQGQWDLKAYIGDSKGAPIDELIITPVGH